MRMRLPMDYTKVFLLFCLSALMLLGASIAATEAETETGTDPEPSPVQLSEAGETAQSEAGDENVRKVRQFFGPPPPPPFFGPPPPPYYGGYGGYGGGFGGGFQRTRVITRTRYRGRGGYYGGGFYG
ncbi:uncharacterized protein F12A10.7 [Drosophila miranda]|uniref:Uncharacterized protein F12A10.7 n=1 Tax=Drosophila pseudoobscura pseudoobscura TaxID=46245 RepID=A0A6I8V4S0_DROPS|nr:uncharacterized protein F12A10.7 [Drosophila pseudoobscura]XP_017149522.1 uncharacterized protein F12A10.7 [Drosophila miranda]